MSGETPRELVQDLGQEDRVLIKARKLPMDQPLNIMQIDDVRVTFKKHCNQHGLFARKVARELNVSPSTLSQWVSGTYKGDNDSLTHAINTWLEQDERKRKSALPMDFVPTKIAEEIEIIVNVTKRDGCMAAIVAPSGCGKTMLLKALADKYRGMYIYCAEYMTPRSFLAELAQAADTASNKSLSQPDLARRIIDRLRGSNRPIFLDEAHTLPPAVFSRIRAIHDQAEVPIIMAGTYEIISRTDDRSNNRGQFSSRTIPYNVMDLVYNAEDPNGGSKSGRPLFTKEEIKLYLDSLKVSFDARAFELMWAIACLPGYGTLRTVRRIVSMLPDAAKNGKTVERRTVMRAINMLFGTRGTSMTDLADNHVKHSAKVA